MIDFDIEKVAKLINLHEDLLMKPMVAISKGKEIHGPKLG
jgi:hypothetical protein